MKSPEGKPIRLDQVTNPRRTFLPLEFWYFLKYNRKWWMLPILVGLLILCLLVIAGSSSLAPFLYTVF